MDGGLKRRKLVDSDDSGGLTPWRKLSRFRAERRWGIAERCGGLEWWTRLRPEGLMLSPEKLRLMTKCCSGYGEAWYEEEGESELELLKFHSGTKERDTISTSNETLPPRVTYHFLKSHNKYWSCPFSSYFIYLFFFFFGNPAARTADGHGLNDCYFHHLRFFLCIQFSFPSFSSSLNPLPFFWKFVLTSNSSHLNSSFRSPPISFKSSS